MRKKYSFYNIMSISNLFTKNDYTINCKEINAENAFITNFSPDEITTNTIVSESITLSNTSIYNVSLVYFTGLGYTTIAPGIEIKCTLFDRFVFLEIPEITVSLPSGIVTYYFTQSINGTEIFFPFSFKYNSYGPAFVNNTQINQTTQMFYRVFTGNNSPIQLNKVDNTAFTDGTTRFIPTVLIFVRNIAASGAV